MAGLASERHKIALTVNQKTILGNDNMVWTPAIELKTISNFTPLGTWGHSLDLLVHKVLSGQDRVDRDRLKISLNSIGNFSLVRVAVFVVARFSLLRKGNCECCFGRTFVAPAEW